MTTATNFFAGSTHSVDCEHNKVDERMDYAINLGGTALVQHTFCKSLVCA